MICRALKPESVGEPVIIPINSNLYVKGKLASADRLLVDVGTGYYIEKNATDTDDYFRRKVRVIASTPRTTLVLLLLLQHRDAAAECKLLKNVP